MRGRARGGRGLGGWWGGARLGFPWRERGGGDGDEGRRGGGGGGGVARGGGIVVAVDAGNMAGRAWEEGGMWACILTFY